MIIFVYLKKKEKKKNTFGHFVLFTPPPCVGGGGEVHASVLVNGLLSSVFEVKLIWLNDFHSN